MEDEFEKSTTTDILNVFFKIQRVLHKYKGLSGRVEIPEVVVVGGQSDGKSTLIEAFLGFKFNVIQSIDKKTKKTSTLGTRSPILIQMRYKPECEKPVCRIRIEGRHDKFLNVGGPKELQYEIGQFYSNLTTCVTSKEIIIQVDYKYSSDVSLIDLPGLVNFVRKGFDQESISQIRELAKRYMEKPRSIILFVEEGTRDFEVSPFRQLATKVDPNLLRTILVFTKLDIKERELDQFGLDDYFSGNDIMIGNEGNIELKNQVRYYIALPSEKKIKEYCTKKKISHFTDLDFKKLIDSVTETTLNGLMKKKLNPAHEKIIGFGNLKEDIQARLMQQFLDSVDEISVKIKGLVDEKRDRIKYLEDELVNCEPSQLNKTGNHLIKQFCSEVQSVLGDARRVNPDEYGETLIEELDKSKGLWEKRDLQDVITLRIFPANYQFKLVGGSQFKRICNDIEIQIRLTQTIPIGRNYAAAKLGKGISKSVVPGIAAEVHFPELISRIVSVAEKRFAYWLKRVFEHSMISLKNNKDFVKEYPSVFNKLSNRFENKVKYEFKKFCKQIINGWKEEFCFIAKQCAQSKYEKTTNIKKMSERMNMKNVKDLLINEMGSKLAISKKVLKEIESEYDDYKSNYEYSPGEQLQDEDYDNILLEIKHILFKMRDQMADLTTHVNYSNIIRPLEDKLFVYLQRILPKTDIEIMEFFNVNKAGHLREKKHLIVEIGDLEKVISALNKVQKK